MNRLYLAAGVTVVLIVALSTWEGVYSDRFTGASVSAEEFGKLFANVPKEVGPWIGEDQPVEKKVLEVAGAVSHVNRKYTNVETQETVDLWLIVGHSRDICRHTPEICYPNNGFAQDGNKQKQRIDVPDGEDQQFFTARFRQEMGGQYTRVFWAWNANENEDHLWEAPDNQRIRYGNNRALYKMYFTAGMRERDEAVADNTAMEFAKLMLPAVNHALFPKFYAAPEETPSSAAVAGGVDPAIDLPAADADLAESPAEPETDAVLAEPADDAPAEATASPPSP